MRPLVALLAVLALTANASADKWTKTDTAIEGVVLTTFTLDYLQTRQILESTTGREGNPIIGSCRSRVGGNDCSGVPPELYFGGLAIVHVAAMRLLPSRWRNVAQGLTIGVQVRTLHNNYEAGYTFRF